MPILVGQLEDCPHCNTNKSYGRCILGSEGLAFRCKHCLAADFKPVPPITKKIIYLDQFVLSNMLKLKTDNFWGELYFRLKDLAFKNLIVCPYSPLHVEESLLALPLREGLKAMYRDLAGSDQFKRPGEIEKGQMARLLKRFLGVPESDQDPEWEDWAERDPNRWNDYFHVHVDFDVDETWVQFLRADKEKFHRIMTGQVEDWKKNPRSFDEDVECNYASWLTTLPMSRQFLWIWLTQWASALDKTERNPQMVVRRFFESKVWRDAPFLVRWVRMWAKIAEMARNPRGGRKAQLGDYYDLQIVSYYAPYCDAMVIDNGYRTIVNDGRVRAPTDRGTRFFSHQNRDELLGYLEQLDTGMTNEHRNALKFVYS